MKMRILHFLLFYFVTSAENAFLAPIISIDLGTTYSSVGIVKNGKVEIVSDEKGNKLIPSLVAFGENGKIFVGESAKKRMAKNANNTIYDFKQMIGRTFENNFVQENINIWPFKVVNDTHKIKFEIENGMRYSPEEITAILFNKLKQMAESSLKKQVKNVILTVPTYFDNNQRVALKESAKLAGLNVVRLIKEPIAAAMAYGQDNIHEAKNILVLHFGGATTDVSLLSYENGVFEVMADRNNIRLGGRDLNKRVVEYLIQLHEKQTGEDIGNNQNALRTLHRKVEKAKIVLSEKSKVNIKFKHLLGRKSFNETLTRDKFEEINMDLFESLLKPIDQVLNDAFLNKTDISDIVMIGGSTRIPKVRGIIKTYFNGKEPVEGIEADLAVVYGAAIKAVSIERAERRSNFERWIQKMESYEFPSDTRPKDELF